MKAYWCIGKLNSIFLAKLEQILWLYAQPYDPKNPVVCFDERPCFLIGETIAPLPPKAGRLKKVNYAYEKLGSCALLAAIEPLTGERLARLYHQRRKREYALFMKELASLYPDADKIHIVQDNLNTHDFSAFYQTFPADDAFALAQRFQFHYTPTSASWLNCWRSRRKAPLKLNSRPSPGSA